MTKAYHMQRNLKILENRKDVQHHLTLHDDLLIVPVLSQTCFHQAGIFRNSALARAWAQSGSSRHFMSFIIAS